MQPNKLIIPIVMAIVLATYFVCTNVLAHDPKAHLDQPSHKVPQKAEPPTGGHANLAGAATNPIANLIQFQVNDSYSPSNYNSDGYSNTGVIQPVIPFHLPWEKVPLLITRTTLPYVSTPDLRGGVGRKDGFGDLQFLNLFSPKLKTKGVQVAFGSNIIIPTAGDDDFTGSGKWSIGPSALYINMQKPSWQWGLFVFSDFSFASADGKRSHVSQINLEPFVTKHFKKGWYLASPDNPQIYNNRTDDWTLSLGPRLGRVMKLGKQHVNVFGAVYYNPVDNDNVPAAEWTLKAGITFLFPK